ncbi:hypothetical protein GGI00_000548 [Coemansia sp. RSA 2681]|nr:hypothetical protein GGI00_000548 [Coemansia sp. RSA 2681]
MIFLDGKKFACSACIRGHRASSCNHSSRELTEIRPKGRPVTQCERCRQLRKTRKAHVKCLCSEMDSASPAVDSPTSKLTVYRIAFLFERCRLTTSRLPEAIIQVLPCPFLCPSVPPLPTSHSKSAGMFLITAVQLAAGGKNQFAALLLY